MLPQASLTVRFFGGVAVLAMIVFGLFLKRRMLVKNKGHSSTPSGVFDLECGSSSFDMHSYMKNVVNQRLAHARPRFVDIFPTHDEWNASHPITSPARECTIIHFGSYDEPRHMDQCDYVPYNV